MEVPQKVNEVEIFITYPDSNEDAMKKIFRSIQSRINIDYGKKGYSVDEALGFSSCDGFKTKFIIEVKPNKETVDIIDEEQAKSHDFPSWEELTKKVAEEIRKHEELLEAFVYDSEIPGLDYLHNLSEVIDDGKYYLKWSRLRQKPKYGKIYNNN